MTTVQGRLIEIQSVQRYRNVIRTNRGSNFLRGSFSNRDNVRAPIKYRRERQPQHLKRWFFLQKRPIHFHINSTSFIGPVKRIEFFSIENNKSLPALVYSVSQVRFKFRSQLYLLPWIRRLITFRVESNSNVDNNITDKIIRKIVQVQQEKCRTKDASLENNHSQRNCQNQLSHQRLSHIEQECHP